MQRYDVIINGNRTTLLLSEADAAARGLTASSAPQDDAVPAKAKTPANKSRKPAANKRAEAAAEAFTAKADKADDA